MGKRSGTWGRALVVGIIIVMLAAIPVPALCGNETTDQKHVLYLNSYDYTYSWSRLIADGVYSGFPGDSLYNTDRKYYVHPEFLDSKFMSDESYFNALYNLYFYKYHDNMPDIIIVSDDNALRFILEYGDELFPGVPVVFTGINDYESILPELPENYTGIIERLPIGENIEYILTLQPSLDTLYIIVDTSFSGRVVRNQTEIISEKYSGRIDFMYPEPGQTVPEILEDLNELPENSAVLLITYNLIDPAGDIYYTDNYALAVSGQNAVPVYTPQDQYNHIGFTGGYQVSPFEMGRWASDAAVRILNGTDPGDIPVEMNPPYIKMLNFGHVGRFDFKESDIPVDVIYYNKPFSTITIPTDYAVATLVLVLSLTAILLISLVYNNRLKNAENSLRSSLDERSVLLREIHHRVKNNLSIISSIIAMQIISSKEKETQEKLNDVSNRIMSMSVVHDILYLSKDISRINVREIFTTLGEGLIRNYSIGFIVDFEVKGKECLIRPDQAIPVSLVLNEIINNSLKFAFEGRTSGKIEIEYWCTKDVFGMVVSDDGCGIPDSILSGEIESFGIDLIFNVVSMQLNGKAEVVTDEGTKWIISFPSENN